MPKFVPGMKLQMLKDIQQHFQDPAEAHSADNQQRSNNKLDNWIHSSVQSWSKSIGSRLER